MSYIAKHYVDIGRRMYTPGEIVDVKIPENKLDRLLEKGAIIPCPAATVITEDTGDDDADGVPVDDKEQTRENYKQQMNSLGYDASGDPLPDDAEAAEETEETEEVEAPEIDVMDGVISAPEAEAEPPKKTTKGRKKA